MAIDVTGKLLIVKWNGEISSVYIQYTLIVFYTESVTKQYFCWFIVTWYLHVITLQILQILLNL